MISVGRMLWASMREGRATYFVVNFGTGGWCELTFVSKECALLEFVTTVAVVVNFVVRVGFCQVLVRMRGRQGSRREVFLVRTICFSLHSLLHSGHRLGEQDLLGCHCAIQTLVPGDVPKRSRRWVRRQRQREVGRGERESWGRLELFRVKRLNSLK